MKNRLSRWIAAMTAGTMITCPIVGNLNIVNAADGNQVLIENELNYIYIDESETEVGNTQNIVVSWGENKSEIKSINLVVEDEKGSQTILNSEKRVDELFLYEHSFEKGIYHVKEVSVATDADVKTFTAEELDIDAYFGVDEKVNEDVKSDYIEMESQFTEEAVVTIETNHISTIEKSVADALSEQAEPFSRSKRDVRDSNLVIVLDPGHDASIHAGASANGVREEIVTLKIAEYCKKVLEQYAGVSVYMTRTDGNCPFPGTNSIDDILKRVEWAKTKDADAFISFHINSSDSSAAHGAEVYYPKGEEGAQNLAKDIVEELAKLGIKSRGEKSDESYAVIRHSKRNGFPGLIIEHAFVSNASDAKWFQTEENLRKLGEADAAGIINYYGLKKGEWEFTDGYWKWKEGLGRYATSTWKLINNVWYYFDANSNMTTGWQAIGGNWYYMDKSGAMQTGWQAVDGNWYYMNDSGAMQTGWQLVDGNWYYMNNSGAMQTGWQFVDGHWYYMNISGVMQTGFQNVGKEKCYFDKNGVMQTGWQFIDNAWYYFNNSGYLLKGEQTIAGEKWYLDEKTGAWYTGWQDIAGKRYYYDSYGKKMTGWQDIAGKKYYMDKDGVVQTGWKNIDNIWYYFESTGELNSNPSSKPPTNDTVVSRYEIAGNSSVTVAQMVNYYKKSGKAYPAEALKVGGAATIEEFCQIYYEECKTEGIKAEVAFVQAMIETGFLQFGGSVKIEQFNFAGLGASGNGASGNSFENVRIGIRAHVQHLKCYANTEPLKNECVDPRWGEWLRGKAPYVEWLSIPNNPYGTGWAGDVNYAAKILSGIQGLKK